jgi:hypothetical protein
MEPDKASKYSAISRADSAQTLNSKDASGTLRPGSSSPSSPEDGAGGMFFYNSDDMNLIAPTAVTAAAAPLQGGRRNRVESPPDVVPLPRSQSWGLLGKR